MADLFDAILWTFMVLGAPGFIWLVVAWFRKHRKYTQGEALVLAKDSFWRSSTNSDGKTTRSRVYVYNLEFKDKYGVVRNCHVEKSTGKFEEFQNINIWYDPHFPRQYVRMCKGFSFYIGPIIAMVPYFILAVVIIKSYLNGSLRVG